MFPKVGVVYRSTAALRAGEASAASPRGLRPNYCALRRRTPIRMNTPRMPPQRRLLLAGALVTAHRSLRPGAPLVLEVHAERGGELRTLLASLGYARVRITRDLADRDRVVEGTRQ